MRTIDIRYANIIMTMIGITHTEAAYYLGGGWKRWSKFTVNKLLHLLDKRIDLIERDGQEFTSMKNVAGYMRICYRRLEEARDFEDRFVGNLKKTKLSLNEIREICIDNQIIPVNLQKALLAHKWKRTKEGKNVYWKAPEKVERL